jgi:hypothetical protein
VHQHDAGSSDVSFDLGLLATQAINDVFQNVEGVLPAETTVWSAVDGPYFIASDVTVPVNGALVIEPGASVYFANEQSLIVQGRIEAQGTPSEIIRFTRVPGSSTISGGIQFDSTMQDNRITYQYIFYNVQHVAQLKQDSFLTFVNNTVVGALVSATYYQRPTGGEDVGVTPNAAACMPSAILPVA